jgi:subtilisin family serine protease
VDGGQPPAGGTGAQTTGRFLVVYKDPVLEAPKEAERSLREVAGMRAIVSAADFEDRAVDPGQASDADATYFPALGIAVVAADDDQLQSLMSVASDEGSNILAVEPEYIYHALADAPMFSGDYARGFRDGVNDFYDRVVGRGRDGELEEMDLAAVFQDNAQFTWGLQATRVNTSRLNGQGVRVAVLDTGIDLQHPDFRGRRFTTNSFIPDQPVQDGQGHGTHCIGTSCGPERPPTGVRRYGCAFGAEVFAGKVLSNTGSSVGSSVLNGMNWAVANRCQVISMSLGADVNQVSAAFEAAGQRALQAGCLIIAAAGNNANRTGANFGFVGQPANSPSIMAVAAVDSNLRVANFSARSSALTGPGGKVDIAAPGVSIFSSVPVARGTHAVFNGTSMATPHVAGIAAMWCQQSRRVGLALMTTVLQNARRIPGDARDLGSGFAQAPQ